MQRHEVGTPERALNRLGQADQISRSYETILVSEPSFIEPIKFSPTEGTGEVPQPTQRLDVTQLVELAAVSSVNTVLLLLPSGRIEVKQVLLEGLAQLEESNLSATARALLPMLLGALAGRRSRDDLSTAIQCPSRPAQLGRCQAFASGADAVAGSVRRPRLSISEWRLRRKPDGTRSRRVAERPQRHDRFMVSVVTSASEHRVIRMRSG